MEGELADLQAQVDKVAADVSGGQLCSAAVPSWLLPRACCAVQVLCLNTGTQLSLSGRRRLPYCLPNRPLAQAAGDKEGVVAALRRLAPLYNQLYDAAKAAMVPLPGVWPEGSWAVAVVGGVCAVQCWWDGTSPRLPVRASHQEYRHAALPLPAARLCAPEALPRLLDPAAEAVAAMTRQARAAVTRPLTTHLESNPPLPLIRHLAVEAVATMKRRTRPPSQRPLNNQVNPTSAPSPLPAAEAVATMKRQASPFAYDELAGAAAADWGAFKDEGAPGAAGG